MRNIKRIYIFGSLLGVMLLTVALSFLMNRQFVQSQLKDNLIQEIEYTREIYSLKVKNLMDVHEENDFQALFQGDLRSSSIVVLLYNDYGDNIAGNISKRDEGIDPIKTMMLNGLEETLYENGTFYSFTHVALEDGQVYLMLEMSDQKYIEGIRNYYFRTLLILVLVSVSVLLLGYKLIDLLVTKNESLNQEGIYGKRDNKKVAKTTKK